MYRRVTRDWALREHRRGRAPFGVLGGRQAPVAVAAAQLPPTTYRLAEVERLRIDLPWSGVRGTPIDGCRMVGTWRFALVDGGGPLTIASIDLE